MIRKALYLPASILILVAALLVAGLMHDVATSSSAIPQPPLSQPVLETSSETSRTAFDQMMDVVAHKRCVNCHPAGDNPNQGEDSHVHRFGVQRGADGHGVAALRCNSCHQDENNASSGVPGAPHWHLAPASMGWEGLSRVEIAKAMLDPAKNGGRSIQEIETHLTEDALVLWVFEPGVDHEGRAREKPPISKDDYIAAVKTWVAAGAQIPEN